MPGRTARWRVASRAVSVSRVSTTHSSPRAASSRSRRVGFGYACMCEVCETTGFVPSRTVRVARSKSIPWKSQPTPDMRRRTTGYEGASTVPEVNFAREPRRLSSAEPAQ